MTEPNQAPACLLRLPLPAGPYVFFPLRGGLPEGVAEIGPLLKYAFETWLATRGYGSAAPLNIARYRTTNGKTTVETILPLRKKA